MSKMRSDRKPPLAKSPMRLRPRRVLGSNSSSLQTPPCSLTKSQKPIRDWNMEESDLRPEYHTISCELRALAKMVHQELGNVAAANNNTNGSVNTGLSCSLSSPLFEKGRFYDEYSARRNERLKRKKYGGDREASMNIDVKSTPYNLGVTVESSKRRDSKKQLESLRKTVSAAYSAETTGAAAPTPTPRRYMLRSMSKENKKPPLPLPEKPKSVVGSERRTASRKVRRI